MILLKTLSKQNIIGSSIITNKNAKWFCSDDDFKKQTKVQVTNENAQ